MDADLIAVLACYPAVARPSADPEPLGNAGGLSGSRLWRYRAGTRWLVARAWPVDGPPRAVLEVIHGWLAETAPLVFVPVPLKARDGRTLLDVSGRLWEVTPWMPGTADESVPPAAVRVRAGFSALAAFHQRLAGSRSPGPSAGLVARKQELEWLLGGGFAAWERLLARASADPLSSLASRWVVAARAWAGPVHEALVRATAGSVVRQPCLRDVRPGHFLFTGDEVTGLVDFGAMGLDTVATDLARLLSEWGIDNPALRREALDAYSSICPIGPTEISLVEVFQRASALLGAGHWVRWHFEEGRTFNDPEAVRRGLQKGLERISSTFEAR